MKKDKSSREFSAIIEEYKILLAEIQQRVGRQEQLSHLSIIAAGFMIPAFQTAIEKQPTAALLLIFPILYLSMIMLILRHDTMLLTLAEYLFLDLRIRANKLVFVNSENSVWNWEAYRFTHQLKSGKLKSLFHRLLAFTRYGIPFSLTLLSIVLFLTIRGINWYVFSIFERTLLIIDAIGIFFVFCAMLFWVSQSADKITGQGPYVKRIEEEQISDARRTNRKRSKKMESEK